MDLPHLTPGLRTLGNLEVWPMVDSARDRFEAKVTELQLRFRIGGWDGPYRYTPEETVAEYKKNGKNVEPAWMV